MSGTFKIIKQQGQAKWTPYLQEKFDIAREYGTTYEPSHEDLRVEELYRKENLTTLDRVKSLDRILSKGDGKEYLVINKDVLFLNDNGIQVDRYATREGVIEAPLKTINEDGVEDASQKQLIYTIPFTEENVDKILNEQVKGQPVTLTFYEGATTAGRLPANQPMVGNIDMFKEATWSELLLAREKKVVSSMENKLGEVRKGSTNNIQNENTGDGRQIGKTPMSLRVDNGGNTDVPVPIKQTQALKNQLSYTELEQLGRKRLEEGTTGPEEVAEIKETAPKKVIKEEQQIKATKSQTKVASIDEQEGKEENDGKGKEGKVAITGKDSDTKPTAGTGGNNKDKK